MRATKLKKKEPTLLPSPIPTAKGSRSAADGLLYRYLDASSPHLPEFSLPPSHFPAISRRTLLPPDEIDFPSLSSGCQDSIDRLLRSAREFGAFRIVRHGISEKELRSLAGEAQFVPVERTRDYREHVALLRSPEKTFDFITLKAIEGEAFRSFHEIMQSVSNRLNDISGQVTLAFHGDCNAGNRLTEKRIQDSTANFYRYSYEDDNIMEQDLHLSEDEINERLGDHALCFHLPVEHSQFSLRSERGSILSYDADPDTIFVTIGKQLQAWSLGEYKCVYGELNFKSSLTGRTSFSFELKCSSSNFSVISNTSCKIISIHDQILIALCLYFLCAFFVHFYS